jgi:hypothetical protein
MIQQGMPLAMKEIENLKLTLLKSIFKCFPDVSQSVTAINKVFKQLYSE